MTRHAAHLTSGTADSMHEYWKRVPAARLWEKGVRVVWVMGWDAAALLSITLEQSTTILSSSRIHLSRFPASLVREERWCQCKAARHSSFTEALPHLAVHLPTLPRA
jgi:hypothetical protein